MKKFHFSLNNVLGYKQQVLDNLRNEQAIILKSIVDTEKRIDDLQQEFGKCARELEEKKQAGVNINTMKAYETYLYSVQYKEMAEQDILEGLEEEKELKRQEVVAAQTETKSLEKLREKKQETYNKEMQKGEEQFIEEFVSNTRATALRG